MGLHAGSKQIWKTSHMYAHGIIETEKLPICTPIGIIETEKLAICTPIGIIETEKLAICTPMGL